MGKVKGHFFGGALDRGHYDAPIHDPLPNPKVASVKKVSQSPPVHDTDEWKPDEHLDDDNGEHMSVLDEEFNRRLKLDNNDNMPIAEPTRNADPGIEHDFGVEDNEEEKEKTI